MKQPKFPKVKRVAARTPNNREVRENEDGSFSVQPKLDNYWIHGLRSVAEALDAYENPEKYRDRASANGDSRL